MPESDEPDTVELANSFGDPAYGRRVLEDAGFSDVSVELRDVEADIPAGYKIPKALILGALILEGVPEGQKEAARQALAEQRASFVVRGKARLRFPMVLLTGHASG